MLLPLFDESGGTGTNAWYRVYGYAAFRLTGYHLGGQYSTDVEAVQRQRPLRGRLLHPLRRALRRLELQPGRPAAGLLHPPTDPIRGDHS